MLNGIRSTSFGEGGMPVAFSEVEEPRLGLISGGSTPISSAAYKFGEAPFKDYWSDDTKNNSREENRGGQTWSGTAGGVRPRRRAEGSDEAVLGARLRRHVIRRSDCRDGNQRIELLQLIRQQRSALLRGHALLSGVGGPMVLRHPQ